jgi:hypothetical protein
MPLLKHYKAQIDADQGVCVLQINGGPLTIGQGADHRVETTPQTFNEAIAAIIKGSTTAVQDVEGLLRHSAPLLLWRRASLALRSSCTPCSASVLQHGAGGRAGNAFSALFFATAALGHRPKLHYYMSTYFTTL